MEIKSEYPSIINLWRIDSDAKSEKRSQARKTSLLPWLLIMRRKRERENELKFTQYADSRTRWRDFASRDSGFFLKTTK